MSKYNSNRLVHLCLCQRLKRWRNRIQHLCSLRIYILILFKFWFLNVWFNVDLMCWFLPYNNAVCIIRQLQFAPQPLLPASSAPSVLQADRAPGSCFAVPSHQLSTLHPKWRAPGATLSAPLSPSPRCVPKPITPTSGSPFPTLCK